MAMQIGGFEIERFFDARGFSKKRVAGALVGFERRYGDATFEVAQLRSNGLWRARVYTWDEPFVPGVDWRGLKFEDPIAAYTYACIEAWGGEIKPEAMPGA